MWAGGLSTKLGGCSSLKSVNSATVSVLGPNRRMPLSRPCLAAYTHTHNLFHMDPLSSSACRDLPRSSLALAQRKCCGTAFDETWREDVDYDARDLHEDLLSKRVVARSFQSLDVKAQEKSTGLPELHSRGSLPGLQAGDSPGLCEAGFEGSREAHRASRAPFQVLFSWPL